MDSAESTVFCEGKSGTNYGTVIVMLHTKYFFDDDRIQQERIRKSPDSIGTLEKIFQGWQYLAWRGNLDNIKIQPYLAGSCPIGWSNNRW